MNTKTVVLTLTASLALAGALNVGATTGTTTDPATNAMGTTELPADKAVAAMTQDEITSKLLASGYTKVHNVKMINGVWMAEANDKKGTKVQLTVDPTDGHILTTANAAGAPINQ